MPPFSIMIKPASGMCSTSCDYCFYCTEVQKSEQRVYGFMSEKTLKNIIRKTMSRAENKIHYVFQGGEPTLRGIDFFRAFMKYQEQYNKNDIIVQNSLQTNGYALNEVWCQFFYDNHFQISLSIDGTKIIREGMRPSNNGEGTFAKIERSVKLLEQYKVDYNILTVVTPLIAEHVREIYDFYKKKGWKHQHYIACLDPLEEKCGMKSQDLKGEIYGQFLIALFQLWYEDWKKEKKIYIAHIEEFIAFAAGCTKEMYGHGICGIQTVVEADGSVYPCDFYMPDEYKLGNINTDTLDMIQRRRREIYFMKHSSEFVEACMECPYFKLCRGDCQRDVEYDFSYLCAAYRKFFEACSGQIYEIAEAVLKLGK